MRIIKRIVRGLSAYGLRASLFGLAAATSLIVIFGSPEPLKNALENAGAYKAPLTELIDTKGVREDGDNEISINDPLVQESINAALPETRKQEIVEQIVNGTYEWLEGREDSPAFSIDLTDERQRFITTLTDSAFDRMSGLPDCTQAQLFALQQEFDPFKVPCNPPINLANEKNRLVTELQNNNEFLGESQLSGEEVLNEFKRHDTVGIADNIPTLFKLFKLAPFILLLFALIDGFLVFVLADSRKKALNKIGKIFAETSLSLTVTGGVLYFMTNGVKASLASGNNETVNNVLTSMIDSLRSQAAIPWIGFLLGYLVIAIAILVYVHKKLPKDPQENNS